ncbi:MAG TPA: peptidase, partial [Caballeronia sp.]|nr:peptidase [Caballeronia sp.]
MKPKVLVRSLIAAGVISAVGAGAFSAGHWFPQEAVAANAPVAVASTSTASALLPDFTGIVDRNGPAVVNISVTHDLKAGAAAPQLQGLDRNSPFYEFFRQFPG